MCDVLKIQIKGDISPIIEGLSELQAEYHFNLSDKADIVLTCKQQTSNEKLHIMYKNGEGTIGYRQANHFFRAFGIFLEQLQKGESHFIIEETPQFKTIGPMLDLSRNTVMKLETFSELIRKLAIMGFNSAMLYMEDTYEIKNEPYFGYLRGRYSQGELKAMDDYAHQFGIELIPCIQTLAHLEEFLKWDAASDYKDTKGALLLESERTYELLENMIGSVTGPFRSMQIHIGMDEAEEVGRGRFLNQHGYQSRFELMVNHLKKVLQITDQFGLEAMMWSDMFLKLASETGDNYSKETKLPDYILEQVPNNIQLMYWQYNSADIKHYDQMFKQHKKFEKMPAFAGGMWIWNSFAPNYHLSLTASQAALTACKANDVEDIFITLWGDDGAENNVYRALLGLQFYAEHAYCNDVAQEKLKERAMFCTGVDAELSLLLNELDTPPGVEQGNLEQTNPSKFLLWQDVLLGVFDKHVEGHDLQTHYEALGEKIRKQRKMHPSKWDFIFEVPEKLCHVLAIKATIGVELKQAYDSGNHKALEMLANTQLPELITRVKKLREAHRDEWLHMNKPFGWEVIDIRYGGLVNRLETAMKRINDYLQHRIESIDELAQERLYYSARAAASSGLGWCSYYYRMATPNAFFHILPIH